MTYGLMLCFAIALAAGVAALGFAGFTRIEARRNAEPEAVPIWFVVTVSVTAACLAFAVANMVRCENNRYRAYMERVDEVGDVWVRQR